MLGEVRWGEEIVVMGLERNIGSTAYNRSLKSCRVSSPETEAKGCDLMD